MIVFARPGQSIFDWCMKQEEQCYSTGSQKPHNGKQAYQLHLPLTLLRPTVSSQGRLHQDAHVSGLSKQSVHNFKAMSGFSVGGGRSQDVCL